MLVEGFHLARRKLHLGHEDELREKEPDQGLEALDVSRVQDQVQGHGGVAVHDVLYLEVAPGGVAGHDGVRIEAQLRHGGGQDGGCCLLGSIQHFVSHLLDHGMTKIFSNLAGRLVEDIALTLVNVALGTK